MRQRSDELRPPLCLSHGGLRRGFAVKLASCRRARQPSMPRATPRQICRSPLPQPALEADEVREDVVKRVRRRERFVACWRQRSRSRSDCVGGQGFGGQRQAAAANGGSGTPDISAAEARAGLWRATLWRARVVLSYGALKRGSSPRRFAARGVHWLLLDDSPLFQRELETYRSTCQCTSRVQQRARILHTRLDRVIVFDVRFRWWGLGNNLVRWLGLLRLGLATGRATFLWFDGGQPGHEQYFDIGAHFGGRRI